MQVAVNVSMGNLSSLDFPDFVADEARKAGVLLLSLILEVTESQLVPWDGGAWDRGEGEAPIPKAFGPCDGRVGHPRRFGGIGGGRP